MQNSTVTKINSHLYLIQEDLEELDPRFKTKFVNLYLIVGSKLSVLVDTGSGFNPNLRATVENIIGDTELLVFNTHHHFDHVGGNALFDQIHVHKLDYIPVSKDRDVSFLSTSGTKVHDSLNHENYIIKPCDDIIPLVGGEVYDLGNMTLKILHAQSHTPGSIILYTSFGEIFTGDVINQGAFFFPETVYLGDYVEVLNEVYDEVADFLESGRLYPGHGPVGLPVETIHEVMFELQMFASKWDTGNYDEYLESYIHEFQDFVFIFPKNTLI